MKIEDAKALLIDCTDLICRECNDRHRGCEKQKSYPDFASTVLVALEKQIPKEPIKLTYEPLIKHGWVYGCPKCGSAVGQNNYAVDYTQEDDFCPSCGQRLKWE
jgi:rubrerythrin